MFILRKFNRFFEINLGWLFINGNKEQQWKEYLDRKYFNDTK